MSDKIERMRAALALAEAEEAFASAKGDGGVTKEDKEALRELRREFRLNFRQKPAGGGVEVEHVGGAAEPLAVDAVAAGTATPTVEVK